MNQSAELKPRILFAVTLDRSVNLMRGLPELLVQEGWEVHLVSSPGPRLTGYDAKGNIQTHGVQMARTPALFKDVSAFFRWIRLLRSIRPDIVSIGTPKAGLLGIAASLITRVPRRIYHLRGLRLETLVGLPRMLMWAAERCTMSAATEVLAISPSLRNAAIEMKLVSPAKIATVAHGSENGVDLNRFKPISNEGLNQTYLAEQLGLNLAVPVLGFVGRITPDKGLDLLKRASTNLIQEGIPHQLLIIGTNENQALADELKKHSESVPVSLIDRVEDIAPYYHLMTCLIFPTRREGFGNVSIEAQASGIPVITTTATGAIDTVQNNVGGLVVPKDDVAALTNAIKGLLLKQVTFEPAKIRQSVRRFDKNVVQKALVNYYKKFAPTRSLPAGNLK